MHLIVLGLALYFTILRKIGEGKSSTGLWKHVLQEGSDWERNSPLSVHNYGKRVQGYAIPAERAMTYRRKANPSEATQRLLFVDYVGVTWTFSLGTNSWTALSTNEHFTHLRGNSITNLCEMRIVAFGGYHEVYSDGHITKSLHDDSRLWLFNGDKEVWSVLQNLPEGPQARHDHKAFTQYNKESTCQCKESLFVYGGLSGTSQIYLNDFWELRCVDDQRMKYKWIQINTPTWPLHSFAQQHAFSVDSEHIYWLTFGRQNVWILDARTKKWTSKMIESSCSNLAPTYPDKTSPVYDKEHKLLIVQLRTFVLGVYDVNENNFHCVKIKEVAAH